MRLDLAGLLAAGWMLLDGPAAPDRWAGGRMPAHAVPEEVRHPGSRERGERSPFPLF